MRTEDLIGALAADAARPGPNPQRQLVLALGLGVMVSLVGFLAALGVRQDFASAIVDWRFLLKLAIVGLALALAFHDCVRLMRPVNSGFATSISLAVPTVLLGAVIAELLIVPAEAWQARLLGSNARACLIAIPLLAVVPLGAGLFAMRNGAPMSGAEAGASVGRLAAAASAALYAFHCFDDSPLFVATWYTLATLPVMALGSLAGRYALRW